jgi:hypothetical protein
MKKCHGGNSWAISRRSFLEGGTLAGATLGFPMIVPSTVFGANAPSNRIEDEKLKELATGLLKP